MADPLASHQGARWASGQEWSPIHIDCTTAVMLKIIDGKCKMTSAEKALMTAIYDTVKHRSGERLGDSVHWLIARVRSADKDPELITAVYEQRVLAETMISRPVMKAYKAMLREQGLIT